MIPFFLSSLYQLGKVLVLVTQHHFCGLLTRELGLSFGPLRMIEWYHVLLAAQNLFPCESPLLVEFVVTAVQLIEARFEFDLHLFNNTRSENSSAATTGRPGPAPLVRGVTSTITRGVDHFRPERGVTPTTVGKRGTCKS